MREQFPDRAASHLCDFHVLEIGAGNWRADLLNLVKPPGAMVLLPGNPLISILRMAESGLKSRAVVAEPYVSTDFADEYAAFYSRIFQDVPRLCWRLHFFHGIGSSCRPVTKADLLNMPSEVRSAYQGYATVRPTTPLLVGDTVLASHHHQNALDLVHCQPEFDVHLLGHTLQVRGDLLNALRV